MTKIGVIGAGSWGYALAVTLAGKGHDVKIWDLDQEHLADMAKYRENRKYLPGVPFPATLNTAKDEEEALQGAEIVLFAAPAQHFRSALAGALPYMKPDMVAVNVAKGIEQGTLKRMSEVAEELAPDLKYVVLAGPSHAEEVGKGIPTTVAVASEDAEVAKYIQKEFSTDHFRIYTADDLVGIELGGAIKNVIALGAGITDAVAPSLALASVGLEAELLDQPAQPQVLASEQVGQLGRPHRQRLDVGRLEAAQRLRVGEGGDHGGVGALDDPVRQALVSVERQRRPDFAVAGALFGHGRHVRQLGQTLRGDDGERLEAAGLDVVHHQGRTHHGDVESVAQQILHAGRQSLVVDRRDIEPVLHLQQFGHEMRARAVARVEVVELARMGFRMGDELRDGAGR